MSEVTLHYFGLYAKAEVTRMILHYTNTPFNDRIYSDDDTWLQYKKSGLFEFEQLPMLEIDGLRLVQSLSIERYLCQKFGYYPSDPYEIHLTESLQNIWQDFIQHKVEWTWIKKDLEGWDNWCDNELPRIIQSIEARYINNGCNGHFVGNSTTLGDFCTFRSLYDHFMISPWSEKMMPFLRNHAPKLLEFAENFLNSSLSLKNYLANRPERRF
ncbi:unnamed protein product [Blepharisma stoltei]|uniref:Glutathione S-transferase n=1 Tax=Blepharisma stoltei TaxID=1481888 RepID=A0AAU9J718_9CILI|nr:unnamed protein product [Blepharisma stoltei]